MFQCFIHSKFSLITKAKMRTLFLSLVLVGSSKCQDPWTTKTLSQRSICPRLKDWCHGEAQTYLMVDVDGDNIIDHVCSDNDGRLWYIGSASKCQDPWIAKTLSQRSICNRPKDWCKGENQTYLMADVDGDNIIDPVCSDNENEGKLWYMGSTSNCQDDPWSVKFLSQKIICPTPIGWCIDEAQTYLMVDIDGDGLIDPVCSDSCRLRYLGSASKCQGIMF